MPLTAPLGVLLAGGASTRFGAPKALARVGGVRVAERVARALREAVPDVVAIANDPALVAGTGLPVRADVVAGAGPLGGILTALRWAAERGSPGALCVACDLPFVPAALLRLLASAAVEGAPVDGCRAVVPDSPARHGFEPLCAVYPVGAIPVVAEMLERGERQAAALAHRLGALRIPRERVQSTGAPGEVFLNLNTPDDHRRAEAIARAEEGASHLPDVPPAVSIVGRKNSGKTTLTVALVAELKRRGHRVATMKHGHHLAEFDREGTDSWRHFHEGGAEAVLMASAGKVAMVMRFADAEPDPRELVERFYGGRGYDLVLVEGYKHGPFPKIEVFRRAVHDRPIHDPRDGDASLLTLVTDAPASFDPPLPVVALDPDDPAGTHVAAVADLLERRFLSGGNDGEG